MPLLRILVVDDSPAMRRSLIYALQRMAKDIQCIEAENGADALKKMNENSFNLVLTDINMPMMDGLKLLASIRQNPAWRSLPVVVITTSLEDRQEAMELGANLFLTKPVQGRTIVEAVSKLLSALK